MDRSPVSQRPLAFALACLLLGGCAGSQSALVPAGRPAPGPAGASTSKGKHPLTRVGFRFKIHHRRRGSKARFIPGSTASIQLTVMDSTGSNKLAQTTFDTHPGFSGCTTVDGTTGTFSCSTSLVVPAGHVLFDATAFDGNSGTGTALSAVKNFPYTIVVGNANQINLTLGGIPVQIDAGFTAASPFVSGDSISGFHMGGTGAGASQQLAVQTIDQDGDTIIGAGSPTFNLLNSDPTDLSVTPVSGSNGLYTLTPLHPASAPITLQIQATPAGGAGSPIYASVQISLDPIVYVANGGTPNSVTAYAPWSSSPILTIPASSGLVNPFTVALDSSGNVYVANFSGAGSVEEFAPGSTTASRVITHLTGPAFGLAIDSSGDIFVSEYAGQTVKEFTPSSGNTPSRTLSSTSSPTGINKPTGLGLDAGGNLYVANNGGTIGVSVYAPGTSTTPAAVFNTGMNKPSQLAFDTSGNLYVANNGGSNVTEYKPPFTNSSTVLHTFSSASTATPFSVAVDGSGNVYTGQASGGNIVEFAPGGSIVRTISGYSGAVYAIAIDSANYAYITDNGASAIGEYSPSSGVNPVNTWTAGVNGPYDVVVWP